MRARLASRLLLRLRLIVAGLLLAACGPARPQPSPLRPVPGPFSKALSFAILEDYDKGDDLRLVARDFALFKELGISVWRGSFGWDDYEPEPGRFDFKWLTGFVALADSMGISLRPYLGYTPAWAARGGKDGEAWNDPPGRLDDWTRFVERLAGALANRPNLLSYEIYNEENVPLWWEGTAEEYAAVLRGGAAAVRRADADAQVLIGGLVWPDAEWLEPACQGGAPFDILPIHAYPETWTPDSVRVENYLGRSYAEDFLPAADDQCGPHPIWVNEAGFATSPGKSERQQAEWWVRAFASFLAAPRVEHLGIYEIKDQRQGTAVIGDAPNYYLGLVRVDGTPKLAFSTVKLLVSLFRSDSITVADSDLRVRVTEGSAGELYHHLFVRPDGTQLVFVWDRAGAPTVELRLRRPGGEATAYEIDGRGRPWPSADGITLRDVKLEPGRVRIFEVAGREAAKRASTAGTR